MDLPGRRVRWIQVSLILRVAQVYGQVALFRTDRPSDAFTSGYYDLAATGAPVFTGSPFIYDAVDVGTDTYLLGAAGTLMRISHVDLRLDSVSLSEGEVRPGVIGVVDVNLANPTATAIPPDTVRRLRFS